MLRQVSHEISWLAQAQLAEHGLANPSVPDKEVKRSKCDTARLRCKYRGYLYGSR